MPVHPGSVNTDSGIGSLPGLLQPIARLFFSTPLDGATTSLFAATAPEVAEQRETYKGQYLSPYGKVKGASAQAKDPELAKALWITTRKVVDDILVKIDQKI
jgi:hypothetical protein